MSRKPSFVVYRTFGYFINEVLAGSIEEIFNDINKAIFEKQQVDLDHLYIDGSKFEANANKYSQADSFKRQQNRRILRGYTPQKRRIEHEQNSAVRV